MKEQRFWFELVDEVGAPLGVASVFLTIKDVDVLRDAVFAEVSRKFATNVAACNLAVFRKRSAFETKQALRADASIESFGSSVKEVLIVQAPRDPSPFVMINNDLGKPVPYVVRRSLLNRVYEALYAKPNRFFVLAAPRSSGKTVLMKLFANRFRHLQCHYQSFMDPFVSAAGRLFRCGNTDVARGTTELNAHQQHVIVIDDAQQQYEDKEFWSQLIKMEWPANVRVIICAQCGVNAPVEFESLEQLGREDFLVSDDEARALLTLPTVGLPERMRTRLLMEVMVRECNGLVGALRRSVDAVARQFTDGPTTYETETIRYYLSDDCLQRMALFCLGEMNVTPSADLRLFLTQCLVTPTQRSWDAWEAEEDKQCWTNLKNRGVVVEDADRIVMFSSPLAERFYSEWLFPKRALSNPSSLFELIKTVLGNLSASALRQSSDGTPNRFPTKAVFQQQLLPCLALHTKRTISICHEVSRVLSVLPTNQVDFYLSGTLQWGLDLLASGGDEKTSGVAVRDWRPPLTLNEFAVVDFRGNEMGDVTGVERVAKRVTWCSSSGTSRAAAACLEWTTRFSRSH